MNRTPILFLNVLIIAACGLVYELLAGTVASYVLGDSVTQFSIIIGLYLFALGAGAWLSRFLDRDLAARFVDIELGVALLGGFSAPLLFLGFARLDWFPLFLYLLVFLIGMLVGLELPILMRILQQELEFKDLVSRVLTFDYVGSLFAAILFPIFLVPRLGLVRTSLLFGMLNAAVGIYGTWLLRPLIRRSVTPIRVRAVAVIVLLAAGWFGARHLTSWAEDDLYADRIIYSVTTPYQRIVMTRTMHGFDLFLDGNLQFSSADEYRYHESLVHPAMAVARAPRNVLILGGGDGLALREVLKYPVHKVTLIDIDREITRLAGSFDPLERLNQRSLHDRRVRVVNDDAMTWIARSSEKFDVVIIDFPDPNNYGLGKLYTGRFYRSLRARLAPDAAVALQATSPMHAPRSYWCIVRTMESAGFHVQPYQTTVPSFGVWGFALARTRPFDPPTTIAAPTRFLDDPTLASLFSFPPDMAPVPVEINELDNQILVRYYEAEWRKWL